MVKLEIVTPEGNTYENEVKKVIVRGIEGDLAFMEGTAPLVTPLGIGVLRVQTEKGEWKHSTINEGYVTNLKNKVTIVTSAFEWSHETDKSRAKKAKERAETRIERSDSDMEIAKARAALRRALNRLRVSGH